MSMYKCACLFVANVWIKLEQDKLCEGIQELLLIFLQSLYDFEFFVKLSFGKSVLLRQLVCDYPALSCFVLVSLGKAFLTF